MHMVTKTDNGTEVSTVQLPRSIQGSAPYETCLFFTNGDSNVVDRYATESAAIKGHHAWIVKINTGQYNRNHPYG
jgi:hypothetical protein